MQKSFSIFEKGSLDFLNVLQNGYFGNGSLKDSLMNQKWFFYGITAKNALLEPLFLRVYLKSVHHIKQLWPFRRLGLNCLIHMDYVNNLLKNVLKRQHF